MFSKVAIKRPVTTIMLLLIAILAGIVSLTGLSMDLMPKMDIPVAIVSTSYNGAGPNEIETLVSKPLEEALSTVSNVKDITSISNDGLSLVVLQFEDGTNIDMAALDMREKIDLVKAILPSGSNDPMVMKIDPNSMSAIYIGVTGKENLMALQKALEDRVENRLERIDGVASVSLSGGLEEEISVELIPERLAGYGVTEEQILGLLASENLNLPSGRLVQGNFKLQVRSVGQFKSLDEIRNLPVLTKTGANLRLSDLAVIEKSTADAQSYSIMNGEKSILMVVQKQSTANTVDVSRKVNAELKKIIKDNPDIKFDIVSDGADYIKLSVSNVLSSLLSACILAMLVLFLFLSDIKTAAIIGVSIITSVITTFAIMYLSGMTLNIISLSGLTIGIGMFIDNSIVVMESIYQNRDKGLSPFEAAVTGAKEVGMAVVASTATNCAVFIPMIFIKGTVGQIIKDLALTICFSNVAALVVSFTFVPMACSMIKIDDCTVERRKNIVSKILTAISSSVNKLLGGYKVILGWSLKNRKKVILAVVASFVLSIFVAGSLGATFFPEMDHGEIAITVNMPSGTKIDETVKTSEEVIEKIKDIPELDYTYGIIGPSAIMMSMAGTDSASVYAILVDMKERKRSSKDVAEDIRKRLKNTPGAEIKVSTQTNAMGSGADISLMIKGDDSEELRKIGNDFVNLISEIDGTREVKSSAGKAVPEANITVDRAKASMYGITASAVANAVNVAINGKVATEYKISGTEIDIRVRYDKKDLQYLNDVNNIRIASPKGGSVLLTGVANVEVKDGPVSITRTNQRRSITVESALQGKALNVAQKEIQQKLSNYKMPDGYTYEFTGSVESMGDSFKNLSIALITAILLMYMIIAAQFESLRNPFIIMLSVPLALTGGLFSLFVSGTQISVSGFLGFILLVSVVVNNAIVLIDYIAQVREQGLDCHEALMVAAPARLRPILMTTLTAIVGLLPMVFASGSGTELTQDLSIVSTGGMAFATVITLIFIPVMYSVFEDSRAKRIKRKQEKALKGQNSVTVSG